MLQKWSVRPLVMTRSSRVINCVKKALNRERRNIDTRRTPNLAHKRRYFNIYSQIIVQTGMGVNKQNDDKGCLYMTSSLLCRILNLLLLLIPDFHLSLLSLCELRLNHPNTVVVRLLSSFSVQ